MPGLLIQETPFKTLKVKELHPTFGAEIEGVDFDNVSDETLQEILAAMAKVRLSPRASHPLNWRIPFTPYPTPDY